MHSKRAFTLVELLVAAMILVALAAIAMPRLLSGATDAKINACKTNVDLINSQIEMYYATRGSWPSQLSDVTSDLNYFPDGEPNCPFGTSYILNGTTHRVSDHAH